MTVQETSLDVKGAPEMAKQAAAAYARQWYGDAEDTARAHFEAGYLSGDAAARETIKTLRSVLDATHNYPSGKSSGPTTATGKSWNVVIQEGLHLVPRSSEPMHRDNATWAKMSSAPKDAKIDLLLLPHSSDGRAYAAHPVRATDCHWCEEQQAWVDQDDVSVEAHSGPLNEVRIWKPVYWMLAPPMPAEHHADARP